MRRYATVEAVKAPYFTRLFKADGEATGSYEFYGYDLYAVSVPYPGYGVFTAYFAPEPQTYGLPMQTMDPDGDVFWVVAGYDALCPMDTIHFQSYLDQSQVDYMMEGYVAGNASPGKIFSFSDDEEPAENEEQERIDEDLDSLIE